MKSCKICNSERLKEISIGKERLFFCFNCSIYYNIKFPTQDELKNYYSKEFSPIPDNIKFIEYRRLLLYPEQQRLIEMLIKFKPPPAKILDIGCDRCYFIDEARRYGYEVKGVEISERSRNFCSKINIETYKSIDEVEDNFDIITLWHSLEHLSEPLNYLQNLLCRIKDDGLICIRVPNFDSFWRKLLRSRWIWFQPQNHLFHYTKKSLQNLLNLTGYKILFIKSQKPNNFLTLFAGLLSIIIHMKREKIFQKMKTILKLFYEYLTGVEIIAVCKKN